jgi:hypothetical protein
VALGRVVVPLCAAVALGGLFMAYYNWRGTGSALLAPYMVNEKTYFSTPPFLWQAAKPAIHFGNPQFEKFYNEYCRELWSQRRITGIASAVRVMLKTVRQSADFFLWPELCLPLLALPWILRDRRVRLLVIQVAIGISALLLATWFVPHYLAPVTAAGFALVLQGMRHLRLWRFGGRPVGVGLTRVVVLLAAILAPFHLEGSQSPFEKLDPGAYRVRFIDRLEHLPGKHLVVVRYSPRHFVLREWVYNAADIDDSKIVWAREIPGVNMQPLFDYFRGRQAWVADPDSDPPQLMPFAPPAP